jgi:hypothetical protein
LVAVAKKKKVEYKEIAKFPAVAGIFAIVVNKNGEI